MYVFELKMVKTSIEIKFETTVKEVFKVNEGNKVKIRFVKAKKRFNVENIFL